ncbi:MAG TPA: tetratricopeptide repeat protein [Steroidobacteraceae bacterium]|nr:tetratricopeptide repeat protein [Steroidobacteraceae bacterium]
MVAAAHEGRASLQQAQALYAAGALMQAEQLCRQLLGMDAQDIQALSLLGVIATRGARHAEAVELFARAARLRPDSPNVLVNYGNGLRVCGRLDEALAAYERALSIGAQHAEAHNGRAAVLHMLRRFEAALAGYEQALRINPRLATAHYNRGLTLRELGRQDEALASFEQALRLRESYPEASNDRGNALRDLGRLEEALVSYDRALQLKADFAAAYSNRGNLLRDLRRYEEALQSYERALALDPGLPGLQGVWLYTRLQLCEWRDLPTHLASLMAAIRRSPRATLPFPLLAIADCAALQRQVAQAWSAEVQPVAPAPPGAAPPGAAPRAPQRPSGAPEHGGRLRIGYLSGDLREHALSYLMVGVFEQHDRERFEVLGISYAPPSDGPFGRRVHAAFDRFIDVSRLADREAVALLRELRVDIAIDLMGLTVGQRLRILASRIAPVQASYLGYPGTLAAPYVDYLLADRYVVTPAFRASCTEAIAYLPDCFQANDDRRPIDAQPLSRAALGLAEEAFVYCCFNNTFKLNPQMFALWCRLLQAQPRALLWLLAESEPARANLRRELQGRGIEPTRLVFAGRLPYEQHLARLRLADLFLDTLPFNAGTTASDALWAGLPVLTCSGETFAGRMAGSLLHAAGLPELVTHSLAEYEQRALQLAGAPGELACLRARLLERRGSCALFDTHGRCRGLERAYLAMHARHLRGERATDLIVGDSPAGPITPGSGPR